MTDGEKLDGDLVPVDRELSLEGQPVFDGPQLLPLVGNEGESDSSVDLECEY